jgi:hypothetical protein
VSSPGSTSAPCGSFEQGRGRRDRAGGTRRDHRPGPGRQALRLRRDQPVAPLGRLDAAFFREHGRPILARDLEKPQRLLPVFVHVGRHEAVEPIPRHLPHHHVIHQPGQLAGQQQRRRRAVGDQRKIAVAAHLRAGGPFQDQLRQQNLALESADRFRQIERGARGVADRGFGERQLILVDIADRHDARQDRGIAVENIEKDFLRQPAGAPRRQIDRCRRQRQRIGAGLEAQAQPVLHQRFDQRRQERRRRGNREDVR